MYDVLVSVCPEEYSHIMKPKQGTQNPMAQKGRKSEHQPWFWGVRFALLVATWDGYRFPVAFRLIRPKTHPEYRTRLGRL